MERFRAMFGANMDRFQEWIRDYQTRLHSAGEHDTDAQRHQSMLASNPKFILRNYMAQNAIKAAERSDFSEVNRLLEVLRKPFEEITEEISSAYAGEPPEWGKHIVCSCSS